MFNIALSLASVVDLVTRVWSMAFQSIEPPNSLKWRPSELLRVSLLSAKDASLEALKTNIKASDIPPNSNV